jgi:hypothetical protein
VNPAAAHRAELVIAGVVVVVGLWGLVLARDVSFAGPAGARIADSVQFSPLGALVTIGLAALVIAGAALDHQRVVLVAAAGFGLIAIAVLLTLGSDTNWFGARGSNVSLLLGTSVGLAVLALAPRDYFEAASSRP